MLVLCFSFPPKLGFPSSIHSFRSETWQSSLIPVTCHIQSIAKFCGFYLLLKQDISNSSPFLYLHRLPHLPCPVMTSRQDLYISLTGPAACTLASFQSILHFAKSRPDQVTTCFRQFKGILLPSGQSSKTLLRLFRPFSIWALPTFFFSPSRPYFLLSSHKFLSPFPPHQATFYLSSLGLVFFTWNNPFLLLPHLFD